jgi:hypothetical protein
LVKTIDLAEQQIAIFPNPTTGNISFPLDGYEGKSMKIEVFDMEGRLHFATERVVANMNTLNVATLKNGLYIMRIGLQNQYLSARFFVK